MVKVVSGQLRCGFPTFRRDAPARRGAEQGDPLASLRCGCVIADVTATAIADMRARKGPDHNLTLFGFWVADDGQYICRPNDADLFLECLDRAAAKAGLTRVELEATLSHLSD